MLTSLLQDGAASSAFGVQAPLPLQLPAEGGLGATLLQADPCIQVMWENEYVMEVLLVQQRGEKNVGCEHGLVGQSFA